MKELSKIENGKYFKIAGVDTIYLKIAASKNESMCYARHPAGYNEKFWNKRLVIPMRD